MTRPQIIRADTIDLQDRISPSAKDHTKQPTHPAALGVGPPAPHQAETLREAAAEAEEEQHRNPQVSNDWNEGDVSDHVQRYSEEQPSSSSGVNSLTGANLHQQDSLAIAQNGGLTGAEDAEMADSEGDDGLEDDMMEKMSSSPSIDDGGYSNSQAWPERLDSLSRVMTPKKSFRFSEESIACSSSPFVKTLEYFPLDLPPQHVERRLSESEVDSPLHQYRSSSLIGEDSSAFDEESRDILDSLPISSPVQVVESHDEDFDEYSTVELFAVQPDLDLYGCIENDLGSEVMMIPYESSEEEDYDDVPYPEDPRFVDSGWGGECLQDLEDIDFDLVYALHTFVATVEGQANATKGDTMVLLDDSNSYWWLVRVVKDSSIGYLPAEHIETPTERLARLNKHRNIDLSATMLGDKDQSEKSKNPLRKAIRRRNAKTVTFAAPTYVEASDIEYSSDDEDGEREYFSQMKHDSQQTEQEDVMTSTVEASISNAEVKDHENESTENVGRMDDVESLKASSEIMRSSDEMFDGKSDSNGKSRNGTVRDTDSFFKDDSGETRRITITPNLLRDDSSTSTRTSNDSKEMRQRATPDKLERDMALDKNKDDKKKKEKKDREKEKEKKPGMLSNLFKRNKKGRNTEDEADELMYGKKNVGENSRVSPVPSKDSEEFLADEQGPQSRSSPQRQTSKLQKQPRIEPRMEPVAAKRDALKTEARVAESLSRSAPPERAAPSYSPADSPVRLVQSDIDQPTQSALNKAATTLDASRDLTGNPSDYRDERSNEIASQTLRARRVVESQHGSEEGNGAELREDSHGSSSSTEVSPVDDPFKEPARRAAQKPSVPGAYPDSYNATPALSERLSESPVQVSPVDASHSNPPALMVDTSSQEEAPSPTSSPSPELVDIEEVRGKKSSENSISTPTSNSTWSDAHLRTFFDDDTDVKDLLVVVYDKSGVTPAGPDHPITGNLFKAENEKLADINNRLNNMLEDWLARKAKASVVR